MTTTTFNQIECPEGHANRHTEWMPQDYRERFIEKKYIYSNEFLLMCHKCEEVFHYMKFNNNFIFQHIWYEHNDPISSEEITQRRIASETL